MTSSESPVPPRSSSAPAVPGPLVRSAGEGERMRVLAEVATFRLSGAQTGGAFSLVELLTPPGGGVARHAHADTDELLYVISGSYHVQIGDLSDTLRAGACAFVPRGAPHSFENTHSETACLLMFSVPTSSPERLFVEMAAAFAAVPAQSPALVEVFRSIAAMRGVVLDPALAPRIPRTTADDE